MKLITKEIEKQVPAIGKNANSKMTDLKFWVKLFCPWSNWTWWVAEADFKTGECFGLVEGFERELGYFDLNELMAIRGPGGLKIERDRFFEPKLYADL